MKLVVGLGNPGKKYENTRHNMGFLAIDVLNEKLCGGDFSRTECHSLTLHTKFKKENLVLAKPQTMMNLSGVAVASLMTKLHLKPEDVFVICDDIDLPVGSVRFREKGSGGTHNGLRNIVQHIGENFNRIKIGVGRDENIDLADYVLSEIDENTKFVLVSSFDQATDKIISELEKKIENH